MRLLLSTTVATLAICAAPSITVAQTIGSPEEPVARRMMIRAPAKPDRDSGVGLRLGYLGEAAVNPGVLVGVELPRSTRQVRVLRVRKGGLSERTRTVQRLWTADASGYTRRRSHTGALVMVGATRRTFFGKSFKLELGGSLGYMHTFLDGTVFEVQEDGALVERDVAGRPKFAARGMAGVGQEFRGTRGPWSGFGWTVRGGVLLEAPYNTFVLPRGMLEATLTYRLGGGAR
ncbi:MAG: hypothetical protein AAGI01_06735 [Myxococcota bacterium]